jgi:hypothetical protein
MWHPILNYSIERIANIHCRVKLYVVGADLSNHYANDPRIMDMIISRSDHRGMIKCL